MVDIIKLVDKLISDTKNNKINWTKEPFSYYFFTRLNNLVTIQLSITLMINLSINDGKNTYDCIRFYKTDNIYDNEPIKIYEEKLKELSDLVYNKEKESPLEQVLNNYINDSLNPLI